MQSKIVLQKKLEKYYQNAYDSIRYSLIRNENIMSHNVKIVDVYYCFEF